MPDPVHRTTPPIQSVSRAIAVLRCFSEAEPELRVTELAHRLDLHKSTISRILATLEQEGLVAQNPESGKYRLGVGLISLAGVALGGLDVRGVSQPFLHDLVHITGETVNVSIRQGQECVHIERARSPHPIRYVGWIGRRMPLDRTAAGRIFLAYDRDLPAESQDRALQDVLDEICRSGYAIGHEIFDQGYSSIAAPIFNHQRQVIAALSITGPTFRLGPDTIDQLIAPITQAAQQISGGMGYKSI